MYGSTSITSSRTLVEKEESSKDKTPSRIKWDFVLVFTNKDDEEAPPNSYVDYLNKLQESNEKAAKQKAAEVVHEEEHPLIDGEHGSSSVRHSALVDKAFSLLHRKDNEPHKVSRGVLRNYMVDELKHVGFEVKERESTDRSHILVLIGASQDLLEQHAEDMAIELRLPNQLGGGFTSFTVDKKNIFRKEGPLGSIPIGTKVIPHKNFKAQDVPMPESLKSTLNIFTPTVRQRIILDLIQDDKEIGGVGMNLEQLVHDGVIEKAFPTHISKARDTLLDVWIKRPIHHECPVQGIKHYFGEELAWYFCFLTHYTSHLHFPALVGLVVFIVALFVEKDNGWSNTIYSIFIALWSTYYLKSWKRLRSERAWIWNMWKYEDKEDNRPGFQGEDKLGAYAGGEWVELKEHEQYGPKPPIKTKFFEQSITRKRLAISFSVIVTLCMVVVIATVSILAFNLFLQKTDAAKKSVDTAWSFWPTFVGGVLNAIMIYVLNKVYSGVAVTLTQWENHRTITSYNNNLLIKLFLFQFFNSYTSLYYIAFFKSHARILGIDKLQDKCVNETESRFGSGCTDELTTQLITLMVTNIFLGMLLENILPYLKTRFSSFKAKKNEGTEREVLLESQDISSEKFAKYEHEAELNPYEGTINEYSEIVIQFGYLTLFAACFPLAPLLALANNLIEERTDGYKFLKIYNKPYYCGGNGIGGWQPVLEILSVIAIVTNSFLIGYSYNAIYTAADEDSYITLLVVIAIAAVLLVTKFIVGFGVTDIPGKVRLLIARQTYIQDQLFKKHEEVRVRGKGALKRDASHKRGLGLSNSMKSSH